MGGRRRELLEGTDGFVKRSSDVSGKTAVAHLCRAALLSVDAHNGVAPGRRLHGLDRAPRTGRPHQPGVGRDERALQRLGKSHMRACMFRRAAASPLSVGAE